MNTIDILKGILGGNATKSKRVEKIQKRSGGGDLGDLLGSVLGRGKQSSRGSSNSNPATSELEELLGIGKKRQPSRELIPDAEPVRRRRQPHCDHENDDAATLIRAMCNAVKVDGEIDRAEQDNILKRIGDVGREEIDFVRRELAAPLDLEHYCDTVPPHLAERVYAFSVLAIKVDTLREAAYLGRLCSGLELDPRTCNAIHEQHGAPCIFA